MLNEKTSLTLLRLAPRSLDARLGRTEHGSGAYGVIREHPSAGSTTHRAKIRKINAKALTLVEVMLALCVIGIGVVAGVELMARVVKTDGEQAVWSGWEGKMMKAREIITATPSDQVAANVANGNEWKIKDEKGNEIGVSAVAADATGLPYPDACVPLTLEIKDATGSTTVAEAPMLKIKETQ